MSTLANNGKVGKGITPLQFLQLVWPTPLLIHENLELRVIDRNTMRIRRQFVSSIPRFLSQAEKHRDREVYFGVSTRFGQGGKKHDCYRVKTLWADLDGKTMSDCLDFAIKPNILVESGGGIHAYWLLLTPALVRGHTLPRRGDDLV